MKSAIETQVMASVAVIHTARTLFGATALKLYVCAASLFGIASLVWVSKVFENMAQVGLSGLGRFALAAFANTDTAVQLMFVAGAVSLIWLFLDITRSLQQERPFAA